MLFALQREPLHLNWFTKQILNVIKHGTIPKHVGIIMDGSRRYARKMKIPMIQGQHSCAYKIDEVLEWSNYLGIANVTLYMMSIENCKRSEEEVAGFLKIIADKYEDILNNVDDFNRFGFCVRSIGNLSLIPKKIKLLMEEVYLKTNHNKCFLNMAICYSARYEMCRTMKVITSAVNLGEISKEDIDLDFFNKMMCSPKMDVLIRTSGEVRLSNFMLWQIHNAQIFFVGALWPEFNIWYFILCIFEYQRNVKEFSNAEMLGFTENPELSEKLNRIIQKYNYIDLYH